MASRVSDLLYLDDDLLRDVGGSAWEPEDELTATHLSPAWAAVAAAQQSAATSSSSSSSSSSSGVAGTLARLSPRVLLLAAVAVAALALILRRIRR